jgi:hypothetical protein
MNEDKKKQEESGEGKVCGNKWRGWGKKTKMLQRML